jgi:hypothetical protein
MQPSNHSSQQMYARPSPTMKSASHQELHHTTQPSNANPIPKSINPSRQTFHPASSYRFVEEKRWG